MGESLISVSFSTQPRDWRCAALVMRCCGGVVRYKTEGVVRMSTLHERFQHATRAAHCIASLFYFQVMIFKHLFYMECIYK